MLRSGIGLFLLVLLLACGGEDNLTRKIENSMAEAVLSGLEDKNRFTASIENSPLEREHFKGRLSNVDFSSRGERTRIEIQSGDATLNFGTRATNYLQGFRITIHNWRDELELDIYNPEDAPTDGRAYAEVAYSEVLRSSTDSSKDQNWYTYRTRGGTLTLEAVEADRKGGVRGSLSFDVLLLDVKGPTPSSVEQLPLVSVEGEFNIRAGDGIPVF